MHDSSSPALIESLRREATVLHTPCGDGRVVWHRWGAAQAGAHRPLVLLHGGSGSWTHWVRNIGALAASGRQVLVPDLPGFGDSARPPGGGDADAVVPPLAQGLDLLLDGAACDLVGFSFGGMTAGLLAADHPRQVARLVVVGAPAMGLATRRIVVLRPWRHLDDPAAREQVHRGNLAALMLHRPEAIDALAMRLHMDNVVRDRMQGRRLAYTEVLKQALQRIDCPLYAIYGRADALYRGRNEALAAAFAEAPTLAGFHFVDEAGHWVQYERADAFNALLLAVLEDDRHR